ncbi:DUF1444 family protein [Sporolactobacillus shoreae]|uniref:DUF1444 family protein n=1 Tax=Sporolactobacillus shoreae TaxID=1465501 RepID=A0A4Z0GPX6_9BACL|nr:DUF1444 family protein [Sporolactobacillus shoreae]TGA99226.1 DUF1444 family protein [Sporolactobacillus shoreae]
MDLRELKEELTKKLKSDDRAIHFDSRSGKLRIENKAGGKGVTLTLAEILEQYQTKGQTAVLETIQAVDRGLRAMNATVHIQGNESRIFPVIRSASFPDETPEGKRLLCSDHTAETKVFYALDLENSYRLLDTDFLTREGAEAQSVIRTAHANLMSLPAEAHKDRVKNNTFYFINYNDGYDASRILNGSLLDLMKEKARGDLTVSVPHQDVLIFGDIVNPEGYDILAQMAMKFYSEGRMPITILPFIYEKGQLEPIFIMANRRPAPGGTSD